MSEHGEEQEEVACPLCGGSDCALVFEARDLLFGKPGKYKLVRCTACSLQFVNPRPTFASLGAHYPANYHCYRSPEDEPPLLRPLSRRIVRSQAVARLKHLERVLGPLEPDTQILDVGCGRNALLHHIQQTRGVTGLGIEMKPDVVTYVRETLGMPVVEGTLRDAQLESGRFDVAIMLEYLEHELAPLSLLQEARRVLRPGGHAVIEIPDPEGWPARAFGNKWVNLDVPRHLVFFERETLADALGRAGFEVVSHQRFGIPGYIGMSMMLWLGANRIMEHWNRFSFFAQCLGMPLALLAPLMPEFSFVVARAV